MYLAHWNLREEPFQNVADTRFAYLSEQHREGLARLLYIVRGRKLGGVLVGPYGAGKSMILELLAQNLRQNGDSHFIRFDVPPGGTPALLRHILAGLQITADPHDMAHALDALYKTVENPKSGFVHTAMAIDEAQLIRDKESFELIHLLTNIRIPGRGDTPDQPAFTIILSGHMKLIQVLAEDESLCQRLNLIWKLDPLNPQQTVEYVQLRMRAAGGDIWAFDEAALQEVHTASRGIPRIINNICDVALMMGCAIGATRIDGQLAQQAIRDVQAPELVEAIRKGEA